MAVAGRERHFASGTKRWIFTTLLVKKIAVPRGIPQVGSGRKSGLENEMSSIDWHRAPPMTGDQRRNALADMELIACGEELSLPWRRVRFLLDHKLAVVQHPVLTAGSRTSLGLTDRGLRFMDAAGARQTNCA
ncbi:hypothetical protein [Mesorhizobium sp.]|uniref:hypothetical protein n=1 Tax=Mesorhizobium sp. TaxID=1871066 RepID=UPI00120D3649|nr:hypothetical protein [Mesorhizobium sp.]TIS62303.1 MAG: hypothetical protein E5W92_31655 [Mesorhizobium sp.]